MKKIWFAFPFIVLVGGIIGFIVPNYLKQSNENQNSTPISIENDLNTIENFSKGQNYLDLNISAKHKENKNLNYQWFYKFDNTKSNEFYPILNNPSATTNNLKIVDDIEKYNNTNFVCAVYDENEKYALSNATKLVQNDSIKEINTSVLSIERLLSNVPIWSKDFWNDSRYFDENDNLKKDSKLFENISLIIGEHNVFSNIKKIYSNNQLILEISLNDNLEWTKTIYQNNIDNIHNFYVFNKKLYLYNIKLNDSKIIKFDSNKLKDYIDSLTVEEFTSKFYGKGKIRGVLVEQNVGFDDMNQMKEINFHPLFDRKEITLSIILKDNVFSDDLSSIIKFSNKTHETNEQISVLNFKIVEFMEYVLRNEYISINLLNEWIKNTEKYVDAKSKYKDYYYDILKALNYSENVVKRIDFELIKDEINKKENSSWKVGYKNLDGIDWKLPVRATFEFYDNVHYDLMDYELTYEHSKNTFTDVKVWLDLENQKKLNIEFNLVNVRPIIENNDKLTNAHKIDIVINKTLIKMISGFIRFGDLTNFSKTEIHELGNKITYDKNGDNILEKTNNKYVEYVLTDENEKVKKVLEEFYKRKLFVYHFIDKINIKFSKTNEYLEGSYAEMVLEVDNNFLVFDFEPKEYDGVKLELLRKNNRNYLRFTNLYCPFVTIE